MDSLSLQMQLETQKQWIETLSRRVQILTARIEELEENSAQEEQTLTQAYSRKRKVMRGE